MPEQERRPELCHKRHVCLILEALLICIVAIKEPLVMYHKYLNAEV